MMRPDAILINTCRGPVVDEPAVAEALDAGRLWGYGADVYTVEPPPPGHPLIGRPDVLLTPHSAAQTEEGYGPWPPRSPRKSSASFAAILPTYPVNDPIQVEHVRQQLGKEPLYRVSR